MATAPGAHRALLVRGDVRSEAGRLVTPGSLVEDGDVVLLSRPDDLQSAAFGLDPGDRRCAEGVGLDRARSAEQGQ
ncbi:hypothetical protein [Streptomyces sp. NBC_01614]|uniref:hypothetical protein n=1 Tax=Streptomyces sp. NBC_01614 TaxID=2975897 RepID=UPI0038652478